MQLDAILAATPPDYKIEIVLILTVGFLFASILGYITQKLKLSPILGFLLSGYLIGPFSPGYTADLHTAEQLAEIGVILMMFGVGLHFKWRDLVSVKNIAVPGAIGQTLTATLAGILLVNFLGWSLETGIVIGLAIGVASTVVLVRILSDNNLLTTPQGHIAVGWLIVEDLITIFMLLLLPSLGSIEGQSFSMMNLIGLLGMAALKCILLVLIIFAVGVKGIAYIFFKVARTRSQELFTLTILAVTFGIAMGSAYLFGTSIALGAFIAGMMIGQTEVRHQALAHALPLKDAFAVIFFLSVGMLFNPQAIVDNFLLFVGMLAIILLIKPLAAFLIVLFLKHPYKTAIIVAMALAQIGEFSFILTQQAMQLDILPDEGYDVIVACALITIALNPLLFKGGVRLTKLLDKGKHLQSPQIPDSVSSDGRKAIVVGFGPIGQAVTEILTQLDYTYTIIDNNVDTIAKLESQKIPAVFGDASSEHILEAAKIRTTNLLVITIPEGASVVGSIQTARQLNPKIKIFARATYTSDKHALQTLKVHIISSEDLTKHAFQDALWKMAGSVARQYS